MKFGDLKLLYYNELQKAKNEASTGTVKFVTEAYNKVMRTINQYHKDSENVTANKIDELPITSHMKEKLHRLSNAKQSAKTLLKLKSVGRLKMELNNVLGIGTKKIDELIKMGLTDINQLRKKKFYDMLNTDTQLMLKYKPIRKIPYEDIKKIELKLISFPLSLVQLVGSFRRKRPYSKDIDILIKGDDSSILDEYILYLNKEFKEKVYLYSKGQNKVSLIIQPSDKPTKYKLDIFRASGDTYYSNLLYSTGPKEFNIKTRSRAKQMGYLLNQNGLFKESDKKKINLPQDDEKKILSYIKLQYLLPENRT